MKAIFFKTNLFSANFQHKWIPSLLSLVLGGLYEAPSTNTCIHTKAFITDIQNFPISLIQLDIFRKSS